MTQTFWLEPTGEVAVGLRRYTTGSGCAGSVISGHDALLYVDRVPASYDGEGRVRAVPSYDEDDPRWPTRCDHCSHEFTPGDRKQTWQLTVFRRTDTGELRFIHSNPNVAAPGIPIAEPGGCWDASWIPYWRGADGLCVVVRLPDMHDWTVDSRAANCGRPDDDVHRCWVRHGDPRECRLTVDKDGDTCSAGAGSIASGGWHGFLRDGVLVGA